MLHTVFINVTEREAIVVILKIAFDYDLHFAFNILHYRLNKLQGELVFIYSVFE